MHTRSLVPLLVRAERAEAAGEVTGGGVEVPKLSWASATVRKPHIPKRAELVFMKPDAVDARRGVAMFGVGGSVLSPPSPGSDLCLLLGCPDDDAPAGPSLQVWVNANGNKKYALVCRAKLQDGVGDIAVATNDSTTTHHVDHSGQIYGGSISIFLDPKSSGWYAFTISSAEAWSTTGCTIDEFQTACDGADAARVTPLS